MVLMLIRGSTMQCFVFALLGLVLVQWTWRVDSQLNCNEKIEEKKVDPLSYFCYNLVWQRGGGGGGMWFSRITCTTQCTHSPQCFKRHSRTKYGGFRRRMWKTPTNYAKSEFSSGLWRCPYVRAIQRLYVHSPIWMLEKKVCSLHLIFWKVEILHCEKNRNSYLAVFSH